MKGKVVTVLGPVEPESLGLTLTHEHLLHELKLSVFKLPIPDRVSHAENVPICMENLGYIRQYPYSFDENIEFSNDEVRAAVREEMHYFRRNGGSAIVDNCSFGLRAANHAHYLEEMSKATGVKIVAGSGFYVSGSQTQSTLNMSVESLSDKIRGDIVEGMDGTNIKCGCIGEVGCSWPIHDFEKKSLVSTAVVQEETGAPVIIHPGRNSHSPDEIFRIFQEAGGKVRNTVMSHLDRTFLTSEDLVEFASSHGSYCEFDLFGIEVSLYQLDEVTPMPSDAQRMDMLRHLIREGHGDRIVVAHDIHTKHRLMKYGGHGYSHILLNVAPFLEGRGFTPGDIHKILYTNPKDWLTFHN